MAMKETVGSLKTYFILAGLLGGAANVWAALRSQSAFEMVLALVSVAFSLAYLYVGVRLRQLLAVAPRQVITVLVTGATFLAVLLVLAVLSGEFAAVWPTVVLGLLISWYLYVSVRRLAAETQAKPVSAVNS
ncbi:MAG TPA: hypothetical protein VFR31_14605 [Thermoanaerobaculia bacterium]|nr:hypothetical protein [Thermoanaerobaculia bacterium]